MAIAVTKADVVAVAPEFAGESDARVDLFIEYARLWVNETKWASKAKFAIILMTAHLLTKSSAASSGAAGAGTGAVTQERVGELSTSYSAPPTAESASDSILMTTAYGQQYLSLRRTLPTSPLLT